MQQTMNFLRLVNMHIPLELRPPFRSEEGGFSDVWGLQMERNVLY